MWQSANETGFGRFFVSAAGCWPPKKPVSGKPGLGWL